MNKQLAQGLLAAALAIVAVMCGVIAAVADIAVGWRVAIIIVTMVLITTAGAVLGAAVRAGKNTAD